MRDIVRSERQDRLMHRDIVIGGKRREREFINARIDGPRTLGFARLGALDPRECGAAVKKKLARGNADIHLLVRTERFNDIWRSRIKSPRDHIICVRIGGNAGIKRGPCRSRFGSRDRGL